MRRKGGRGRGRGGPSGLLGHLKDRPEIGVRDVRPVERAPRPPEGVELGWGRSEDDRGVALVAASWENASLLGWVRVAALLADSGSSNSELLVAAPVIGLSTRELALRTPALASSLRLAALPALADVPEEAYIEELVSPLRPWAGTVLERVVNVIEGASALTGVGAVRRVPGGFVLYLRGVRVLGVASEGEAVGVTFLEPERRHIHVSESNFPRWGVDLHEQVIQLAQDPRLLERPEVEREGAIDGVAAEAGVRVTARWLPWNRDGTDPIEFVGVDSMGRSVLGLVRPSVDLSTVGAVVGALAVLNREPELWLPGASGSPLLLVSCRDLDPRFREALAVFDVRIERVGEPAEVLPVPHEAPERERRGRRRPRRRRRPRGEPGGPPGGGRERAFEPRESRADERERQAAGGEEDQFELRPDRPEIPAEPEAAFEPPTGEEIEEREPEGPVPLEEPVPEDEVEVEEPATVEEGELDLEDDTLAVVQREEPVSGEDEEAVPEPPPPRPRRPRAAIVVRNDLDSILAALVLARERRNVVLFWVCRQEELMDFFKTRATDLSDNVDILLIGFTAQPVPKEVLMTAEVYRGRIQWFDHHPWPIEDLELLREAVGRDSILIVGGAASPLAPVMRVTERRSRFTDKLVDLSGRRLSENDMQKWGYALAGVLKRTAASTGDYRSEIAPILMGKPTALPPAEGVYAEEEAWLAEHDPRVVHFGEYRMSVVHVPGHLDPGEVARRARIQTGTRLSLASREGDETVLLVANEERRHINVQGLAEYLASRLPWVELRPSGDRSARLVIEDLPRHPERLDLLVSEIARHKSMLYG